MTDQTPDAAVTLPPAFTPDPTIDPAAGLGFLTVEQMLDQARRPRRIARICLRGDLESDYLDALDELGDLVDADGQPLVDDVSMDEAGKITELRDRCAALHKEIRGNTGSVHLEAMDADAWEIFEKKHRGADGKVKDVPAWQNEMISTCAINPTMTVEQVDALRKKLSATSIAELAGKAYSANTTGGVDIPKLPSYSHSPKQQESSLN